MCNGWTQVLRGGQYSSSGRAQNTELRSFVPLLFLLSLLQQNTYALIFSFHPFSPSPSGHHPSTIYPSIFLSSLPSLSVGNGPVMPD